MGCGSPNELRLIAACDESFDPESFDPELTTEGLTAEGLSRIDCGIKGFQLLASGSRRGLPYFRWFLPDLNIPQSAI